ncbi:hypothetical protein ACTHAM_001637 [Cellulomonas soli]|uniref:hypothetical protein n=1 Tax=Cellulomonas soli TaxID=931535 RepID=UPI003F85D78E
MKPRTAPAWVALALAAAGLLGACSETAPAADAGRPDETPRATPAAQTPVASTGGATADTDGPAPVSTPTATVDGRAAAEVVLSFAAWDPGTARVSVGAYANVVESDGTCTLILSQDGRTVTATSSVAPDVSTTSCGDLGVAGDELTSGTWLATVTYDSPTATGTSETAPVEVTR